MSKHPKANAAYAEIHRAFPVRASDTYWHAFARRLEESESALLEALKGASKVIEDIQAVILEYLPPDSGINAKSALSSIIGLTDNAEIVRLQEGIAAALSQAQPKEAAEKL